MKPIASIELRVTRRHRLKVVIWPTKKSMLESSRKTGKYIGRTAEAYFRSPELHLAGRGLSIKNRVVGEIHLVHNRFGAGIFAHELQHFIQYWLSVFEWKPVEDEWEKTAYLAGDLTHEFWRWFYKNFEAKPG